MTIPAAKHLVLPFNRPEYYSVPEALVTALAWKAYEPSPEAELGLPFSQIGFMYRAEAQNPSTFDFRITWPGDTRAREFGENLRFAGHFSTEASDSLLGNAVAQSVLGIRSEKSGNQPASPMTPALALMQNMRGITVKPSPPDYGVIIEQIFSAGLSAENAATAEASATKRWLDAVDQRLESDDILKSIDAALTRMIHSGKFVRRPQFPLNEKAKEWAGLLTGTPYEWFTTTWARLTSQEWVEALPARVWVDWATTVLRLGVGFGYLWEAAWYERIAEAILNQDRMPKSYEELVRSVPATLPWKSSGESISVRDVASLIKLRINRGDKIRKFLEDELKDVAGATTKTLEELDTVQFLQHLAENGRSKLRASLHYTGDPAKLTIETVRYGLSVRESSGPFTDYYGLLRSRGRRWLVIDPGTEWITVLASLACKTPKEHCNVGNVLGDLSLLGLHPGLGEIVNLLENAGLARGSADADIAVVVESAY
ncbi:hypothetical protein ACW4FP_04700 [Paenarthrobacter ureafaciens]